MAITDEQWARVDEIHRLVVRIDDRVDDLRNAVFGNGRAGLADRMTSIEGVVTGIRENQERCPAREEYTSGARRGRESNRIALGALIISVGTALLAWIQGYMR